jgi:hypothetical protein
MVAVLSMEHVNLGTVVVRARLYELGCAAHARAEVGWMRWPKRAVSSGLIFADMPMSRPFTRQGTGDMTTF